MIKDNSLEGLRMKLLSLETLFWTVKLIKGQIQLMTHTRDTLINLLSLKHVLRLDRKQVNQPSPQMKET